jgi:sulfite exporter TauE/SafE
MTTGPETNASPTIAERLRLDVDRRWLFFIAGVIWMGVGVLLLTYAVTWLAPVSVPLDIELGVAGLAVAAVFVLFVFRGIVNKNIERIEGGPERASAFSFQGWKSYVITVFMIVLGIVLKRSPIPKPDLAVMYLGVGLALMLTSGLYHRHLWTRHRASE